MTEISDLTCMYMHVYISSSTLIGFFLGGGRTPGTPFLESAPDNYVAACWHTTYISFILVARLDKKHVLPYNFRILKKLREKIEMPCWCCSERFICWDCAFYLNLYNLLIILHEKKNTIHTSSLSFVRHGKIVIKEDFLAIFRLFLFIKNMHIDIKLDLIGYVVLITFYL